MCVEMLGSNFIVRWAFLMCVEMFGSNFIVRWAFLMCVETFGSNFIVRWASSFIVINVCSVSKQLNYVDGLMYLFCIYLRHEAKKVRGDA